MHKRHLLLSGAQQECRRGGSAIRKRRDRLEWVNIHVEQEPGHVDEAGSALMPNYTVEEEATIGQNSERMWKLWIVFFDRLEKEVFAGALGSAAYVRAMQPQG